jgi:hypothetical protein
MALVGMLRLLKVIEPITIWLSDHGRAVSLGLDGIKDVSVARREDADLSMSSDALSFCLRFDYGFNTANVNGRFAIISREGREKLRRFVSVSDALNYGRTDFRSVIKGAAWRMRRAIRGARRKIDA